MLKRSSIVCLSLSLAILAAGAPPAAAGEACIPDKVEKELSTCTGVDVKAASGHTPVTLAPVAPPPPAKSAQATPPPPPQPKASPVEIRRGLTSVRREGLLITEIQGLETLVASTPPRSPDRPGLLKRLADTYVELEASSFRKKIESGSGPAAAKAEKVEKAARQAAIKYYGQLKGQYPGWCQVVAPGAAPQGCVDETLYDLAYEHEQAGELDQARKDYLELIQTSPGSKYVPNAYLAFGELFFQEAQSDPSKWALAEQSYKEVTKYPSPENKAFGYAHYKLGYVYWNQGDYVRAVAELKKTIENGMAYPTLTGAEQLAVSARRDLIPLYALAGDPKRAFDFFHPLSGDASSETGRTYKWMADLGQNYLDVGRYKDGIDLYQDLLRRDRGAKSCGYQARVTEATLALKTGDKAAAKAELERQLALEISFRREGWADDAKLACSSATAALVTETAMIWHLEAVGSQGVRGTNSPQTMTFAAELYDRLIKQFTAADFARFEFPRIVKEDWPTLLKVKSARADLLYAQKAWPKCGEAFDEVVAEDPRGPLAAEAAYASALCFQNAFLAAHAGHSERLSHDPAASIAPREIKGEEKAMLASFDRYLCVVKPAPSDRAAYDTSVEIAYARARTYFDAHHWAEAAAAFRAIALDHADHESGVYAAQLYLESLNVLGTHGSPGCFDDMRRDVPKIVDSYCKGAKAKANATECGTLVKVQRDVVWQGIDDQAKKIPDSAGAEHAKEWEEVANAYLHLWQTDGQEACEAKQPPCDRMDQVLYNAAKAFQAARLLAKAIAVRRILVDPRYGLERTDLARKSVYDIGATYQAIAVYDEAAAWYERFAHDTPSLEKAPQALEDAIVLRLGLGQEDQALHDADLFEKQFRARHAALASQIAFAIGAHYAEHEDWDKAKKRLTGAMAEIDRSASLDVQIEAHATLGRALWKTGGATGADAEFAKVRALFRDPAAATAKLSAGGGDPAVQARRLGKALSAAGEALFFAAEEKRKGVDAIRFPAYTGSGVRADVERHINTKVHDWMNKKRAAIEEVEKEYRRVLDLSPSPPVWVIASGARVGQMWSKFVAEFRAAPIPKEWLQHGPSPYGDLTWDEIRAAYYEAIDKASEPWRQHAKGAYEACMSYSTKYQYFDDHSRSCELWLSKNYATQYHVIDELRGAPSRVSARIEGQPAILAP
jgi:TolA-binding protein